jgi:replication factor C subunit 3/5
LILILIFVVAMIPCKDSTATASANLPWVEKYRPNALQELISHEDIIQTIRRFISEEKLPHLLFYGPPGTGKTSTILACAKELYSKKEFNSMVLELNASDDRGIDVVRGQVLNFASTRTIFNSGFKLVILDEADSMTQVAQNALRRIIEKFTDNVRFCLICNYLSKIIPALQSRCTRFRFGPLDPVQILPRLEYVCAEEAVNVTEDGKEALMQLAQGDMRKVLNILQSCSMAFDKVDEDNVYTCVGHPLKSDITNVVNWMLNESFTTAYKNILHLKTLKGLSLQDILSEVHNFVHRLELPDKIKIHLLTKMSDLEHRLFNGASEKIQLGSMLAAFQVTREMIKEEAQVQTVA